MPLLDVIEMVCDWHAAYRTYNGAPGQSFAGSVAINKKRFHLSDAQWWVVNQVVALLDE